MSDLVQNRIKVRGKDYLVRELKGHEMAAVRRLLATDSERQRIPAYVSSIACVEPVLGNEKACNEMPHIVIETISVEAIRLTTTDEKEGDEEKKD